MKVFDVFGQKYKVYTKKIEPDNCGKIEYETHRIFLNSDYKEVKIETLIHELLHAVNEELSFNTVMSIEFEEILVDTYAKFIAKNIDRIKT